MKTDAQIDAIMNAIPERWRRNWCGGERGPCACLGCVQTGNKRIIADKIRGERYLGDPEYIDEAKLQNYGHVYEDNKIRRGEWESWMKRHPRGDQA